MGSAAVGAALLDVDMMKVKIIHSARLPLPLGPRQWFSTRFSPRITRPIIKKTLELFIFD